LRGFAPKKHRIGYGRPALEGEEPDFVIGVSFLYPRTFALTWPWNERIDTADDIFMGRFAASAKVYLRRPSLAIPFLRSWFAGHVRLLTGRRYLKDLVRKDLVEDAP
jgi:hypothetical protein